MQTRTSSYSCRWSRVHCIARWENWRGHINILQSLITDGHRDLLACKSWSATFRSCLLWILFYIFIIPLLLVSRENSRQALTWVNTWRLLAPWYATVRARYCIVSFPLVNLMIFLLQHFLSHFWCRSTAFF